MKFKVSRTSSYEDEVPPCEGCVKGQYTRIDERTIDDPNKSAGVYARQWYERGTNHRVENGHIKRDFIDEGWFIEIPTLEDLVTFLDTHGPIVLERFHENTSILELEIYDDYRE
jgi:hypothetical protein